jgi:Uma2 family endonuclease
MHVKHLDNPVVPENFPTLPSFSYSHTKSKLNGSLLQLEQYSVFSELTLRIEGRFYTPDVCVYPRREVDISLPDLLEITEMPVLAIEILSNTQNIQNILNLFSIFFSGGIKSCWLVIPIAGTVIVYKSLQKGQRFACGNIIDEQLNIQLPLEKIFK